MYKDNKTQMIRTIRESNGMRGISQRDSFTGIQRDMSGYVPAGISDDRFDERAITYQECDDIIATVYLMADRDVARMLDLFACSMATLIRDSNPDPRFRQRLMECMIAKVRNAYRMYDNAMGRDFHDFMDSVEDFPEMTLDITDLLEMALNGQDGEFRIDPELGIVECDDPEQDIVDYEDPCEGCDLCDHDRSVPSGRVCSRQPRF